MGVTISQQNQSMISESTKFSTSQAAELQKLIVQQKEMEQKQVAGPFFVCRKTCS